MQGEKGEILPPILDASLLGSNGSSMSVATLEAQKHMLKLRMVQQTRRFMELVEQEALDEQAFKELALSLSQSYRMESNRSASVLSQTKTFDDHLKRSEKVKSEPERALKVERNSFIASGAQTSRLTSSQPQFDFYDSMDDDDKAKVHTAVDSAWKAIEEQLAAWRPSGEILSSVIEKKANSVYLKMDEEDDSLEEGDGRRKKNISAQNKRVAHSASMDLSSIVMEYKSKLEEVYERMREWKRQTMADKGENVENFDSSVNSGSFIKPSIKSSQQSKKGDSSSMTDIHLHLIKEKVLAWITQHEQYVKSVRAAKEEMRTLTLPQTHEALDALKSHIANATASSQLDLHLQSLLAMKEEDGMMAGRIAESPSPIPTPSRRMRQPPTTNTTTTNTTTTNTTTTNTTTTINTTTNTATTATPHLQPTSRFSGGLIPPTPIRQQSSSSNTSNHSAASLSSTNISSFSLGETPMTIRKAKKRSGHPQSTTTQMATPSSFGGASSHSSSFNMALLQTPSSKSYRHHTEAFNADAWLQDGSLAEDMTPNTSSSSNNNNNTSTSLPDLRLALDSERRLPFSPLSQHHSPSMRSSPVQQGHYSKSRSPSVSSSPHDRHCRTPSSSTFIRLNSSIHSSGSAGKDFIHPSSSSYSSSSSSSSSSYGRSKSAGRISARSSPSLSSPSTLSHGIAAPLTPMRPIEMPFLSPSSNNGIATFSSSSSPLSSSPSPLSSSPSSPSLTAAQLQSPLAMANVTASQESTKQAQIMEELAEHIIDIMAESRPLTNHSATEATSQAAEAKRRREEVEKYTKAILAIRSPSPSSPATFGSSSATPSGASQSGRKRHGSKKSPIPSAANASRSHSSSTSHRISSSSLVHAFAIASKDNKVLSEAGELPEIDKDLDQLEVSFSSTSFANDSFDSSSIADELAELDEAAGIADYSSGDMKDSSSSPLGASIEEHRHQRTLSNEAFKRVSSRRKAALTSPTSVREASSSSTSISSSSASPSSFNTNAFALIDLGSSSRHSLDVSVSLLEAQLAELDEQHQFDDGHNHDDDDNNNDNGTACHEEILEYDDGAAEEILEEYDEDTIEEGVLEDTLEEVVLEEDVDEELEAELARLAAAEEASHDRLASDLDLSCNLEDEGTEMENNGIDEYGMQEDEHLDEVDSSVTEEWIGGALDAEDDVQHSSIIIHDGIQDEFEDEQDLDGAKLEDESLDENHADDDDDDGVSEMVPSEHGDEINAPSLDSSHVSLTSPISHSIEHYSLDESMNTSLSPNRRSSTLSDLSLSSDASDLEEENRRKSSSSSSSSSANSVTSLLQLRGGTRVNSKTVFSLEPLLFDYPTPSKGTNIGMSSCIMPLSSSSSVDSSPNSITSNVSPSLAPLTPSQTKALLESPLAMNLKSSIASHLLDQGPSSQSAATAGASKPVSLFTLDSSPQASPSSVPPSDHSSTLLELLPISQFDLLLDDEEGASNLDELNVSSGDASSSPLPTHQHYRLNLSINPDEDANNSSVSSSSPGFERIKKVLLFDGEASSPQHSRTLSLDTE